MKRIIVKKGDVFAAKINDESKRYFQYITNDLKQLNSDVIRCFKKTYPIEGNYNLEEIVKDEISFYAHCITKLGVKLGHWEKVGNIADIGTFENIMFRDTNDYGKTNGEENVMYSNNWHVWRIGELKSTYLGKLDAQAGKADIGLIFNPLGVIALLKGNKYPVNYPDF